LPDFRSLTDIINAQLQAQKQIDHSKILPRSEASIYLKSEVILDPAPISEENVVRWGFSRWGVEKVTSNYKPDQEN
jgi:hypothetical protein